tara:strand:+ start:216 stop:3734 length:3519 start_codon:yes stop_codon:yes gene_type:complete
MIKEKFVHLRLSTEYSVNNSTIRLSNVVRSAANDEQRALALTDLGNTFAYIKFYRIARENGIKPILGVELRLRMDSKTQDAPRIILLCKNRSGYKRLCRIISRAWLDYDQLWQQGMCNLDWFLEEDPLLGGKMSDDLICFSGGIYGELGLHGIKTGSSEKKFLEKTARYLKIFKDNFYLEIHRAKLLNEDILFDTTLYIANKHGIPVVATHPIQFLEKTEFLAHQARVAIADGETLTSLKSSSNYTSEQFFLSQDEMVQKFIDVPGALENTVEIAKRCNLEFEFGHVQLPNFSIPGNASMSEYLKDKAFRGLRWRFTSSNLSDDVRQKYDDRLISECNVISKMGFSSYFLIVSDFVNWAKNNGVPVGPGRGSGAGSLVAFCLNITDVDPIKFSLLFERFLNPERVSMPDFDIDFCQEQRYRVIEYVKNKYGTEAVSQIITFGTMASRAVIRDAGRVLELPYIFCDQLSKLVPVVQNKPLSLKDARNVEPLLSKREKEEEEVANLMRLAEPLEDLVRNVGMHAGGVLIAPGELTDFCPLYKAPGADGEEGIISMFDKDDIEQLGLVKFDFLGLRNLTILDMAIKEINALHIAENLKLEDLNEFNDAKTYDLLKTANTTAVFQLESEGMKRYLLKLQPDCFEDIIAMLALYRPGPLNSGMVDDFIKRKQGVQKIDYFHDDLKECLAPTYGVIVYQEQVMQIAQIIAGYSLGNADILRRAMGKKKVDEMSRQRKIFIDGASSRGYSNNLAIRLFDLMEKFAEYGFNKSHTAAYAFITYQTAWLKSHHPAAFYSATLTSDIHDTDRIALLIQDCKKNGIVVVGPSINYSMYAFTTILKEDVAIVRFGLGAIKGVGESVIKAIINAREQGEFKNLLDFCSRIDRRVINKKSFEALICSGSMDELHGMGSKGRNEMLSTYESFLLLSEQRELAKDQGNLFGEIPTEKDLDRPDREIKSWTSRRQLQAEKQALGFPFSRSFFSLLDREVSKYLTKNLNALTAANEPYWIHGVLTKIKKQITRRGPVYILELTDETKSIEVSIQADHYEEFKPHLKLDEYFQVLVRVREDEYSGGIKLSIKAILDAVSVREKNVKFIKINVPSGLLEANTFDKCMNTISDFFVPVGQNIGIPVILGLSVEGVRCDLSMGKKWLLYPSENVIDKIRESFGEESIEFHIKGE